MRGMGQRVRPAWHVAQASHALLPPEATLARRDPAGCHLRLHGQAQHDEGARLGPGQAGTGSPGWAWLGIDPQMLCPRTPPCHAARTATTLWATLDVPAFPLSPPSQAGELQPLPLGSPWPWGWAQPVAASLFPPGRVLLGADVPTLAAAWLLGLGRGHGK